MRSWPRRAKALSIAALIALAAPACSGGDDEGGDEGPDEGPWASLAERPCPEDSSLSYESFGGPFMLNWCNGCHSADLPEGMRQNAPLGVDFNTLEDIRRQADRIWARSGDQNATMPPVGGPPAEERALLGEWLACGAPANADL